ncbi:MAG: T9SS type A sorting domain-containing protein, partial [Bacteroidota bacterium]
NDGSSWTDAFTSLEDALSATCPDGTIYVARGTYIPTTRYDFDNDASTNSPRDVSFKIPSGVKIYGGFAGTENGVIDQGVLDARDFAANETTLSGDLNGDDAVSGSGQTLTITENGENAYHVVYTQNVSTATLLDGVIITGGSLNMATSNDPLSRGAGWYNEAKDGAISSPTLQNVTFRANMAGVAAGMYNFIVGSGTASPELRHVKFLKNRALVGAGLYNLGDNGTSSPRVLNTLFAGNHAELRGGGLRNYVNSAGGTASPVIINCTFVDNYAGTEGAALHNAVRGSGISAPLVRNSIFWANTSPNRASVFNQGATPDMAYSLVQESSASGLSGANTGVGMIYGTSPGFLSIPTEDYRLRDCSPAVDAGDNTVLSTYGITKDLDGENRTFNVVTDLGVYERQSFATTTPALYVNQNATGNNDGSSWTNAFTDLESALANTCPNGAIYVAAGAYIPTKRHKFGSSNANSARHVSFKIPSGIKIYGGFAGTESGVIDQAVLDSRDFTANQTILSGDLNGDDIVSGSGQTLSITGNGENAYHVIYTQNVDGTTVLDGVTITGGNADFSTSDNPLSRGGAWYNEASNGTSSPTIQNVIFRANAADVSGGMYNFIIGSGVASPEITNTQFVRNTARVGGAIYNLGTNGTASPVLTNNLFVGNYASFKGAAVRNWVHSSGGTASPEIINCTFVGNYADEGAAIHSVAQGSGVSVSLIRNSIFWNNASPSGITFHNENNAAPDIAYSLVQEANASAINSGTAAGTNVGANMVYATDPLFVDEAAEDFRLAATSSVIDAGVAGFNTSTRDLGGATRVDGAAIDFGAYESVSSAPMTRTEEVLEEGQTSDFIDEASLLVYPNPTNGLATLRITGLEISNELSFELIDALGRTLEQKSFSDNVLKLDLTGYSSGTYLIRVSNGKETFMSRVVKQ